MVAGLGVGLSTSMGPASALGEEAFLGLESSEGAGARLGLRLFQGHNEVDDRQAKSRAFLARLSGCPLSWSYRKTFFASPCGAVDLGQLKAWGVASTELAETGESYLAYSALVGILRMNVRFTNFLGLQLEGESSLVLNRHNYVFEQPRKTVFSMPRAGFGTTLGLVFTLL